MSFCCIRYRAAYLTFSWKLTMHKTLESILCKPFHAPTLCSPANMLSSAPLSDKTCDLELLQYDINVLKTLIPISDSKVSTIKKNTAHHHTLARRNASTGQGTFLIGQECQHKSRVWNELHNIFQISEN